jgi:hypothetical protein
MDNANSNSQGEMNLLDLLTNNLNPEGYD